jgi:hypothetical protein
MSDLDVVATFGGGALLLFSAVYYFYDSPWNRTPRSTNLPHFNITFARLFGLITVAVLGVGLAFANVSGSFAASAFTLLGTIAGYLAGAKPTVAGAAPTPHPGAPSGDTGPTGPSGASGLGSAGPPPGPPGTPGLPGAIGPEHPQPPGVETLAVL